MLVTALIRPVYGATDELEFKLLNPQKREINPGDNINLMLEFSNQSDSEKTFQLELSSDVQNLRFLSDYSSIKVEKKSTIKKVIGIKIPTNLAAGDVSIPILCKNKESNSEVGRSALPVTVLPKFEFSLNKLKSPSYILSGEDIPITYELQNLSNLAVKVKATFVNGSENETKMIELPKDSSLVIKKNYKTEKKVSGFSSQSIFFIAQIEGMPETESSVYTPIDIFPSEYIKFDKFERFPVTVSTVAAMSNRAGELLYSGMYDILGMGALGKNADNSLEFHVRGPNRSGNPLFGMNDEYYLKYKSPKFSLNVGDYSFGLSELTESSRSGKGIEMSTTFKKITVGGYYNIPRYYPLITSVYALSGSFQFNPKNSLSAGFLSKVDTLNKTNTLYSISGGFSPFSWISSESEIAFEKNESHLAKAFKTSLQLNISKLNTHFVYLYADPDFQGFVKNSSRFNFGSSLQLKKITFSVNYDMNSTNFALDTLYSNMPISKSISANASYRVNQQNTLNLSYNDISLTDRSTKKLFDYTRRGARAILQNRLGSLTLSLLGDVGQMNNRLDTMGNGNTIAYNGTFAGYYLFKKKFTASFFASYQGGAEKNTSGNNQFYYGGGFSANLNSINASLQYTSNYEWKYYTSDRSLLSMILGAHINPKNELSLTANYNLMKNTLNQKEYNIQLRYIHKLNMPIGRKRDLGGVSGKILNHGIPKVEDIRLNLNGILTMSDKEGNYRFPVVPVGTHILAVDASSLGIHTMVESTGPLQVKVEPGRILEYNIPMTTTGSISGRLVVQEDERSNQKGFIAVKETIEKLIVEVSNENQLLRVYTDKNGNFNFDDLLPGKWQVKVYPNGLPQGYNLVTSIFNIELTYGKHEFIEVMIQKKARQIQFQRN